MQTSQQAGWANVVVSGERQDAARPVGMRALPIARRNLVGRVSTGHVLMIVAGLLGAFLTLATLRAGDHRVEIAVAARDVNAGEMVTSDTLRFTRVSVDGALRDAMVRRSNLSTVTGSVAAGPITAGEPILRSSLVRPAADRARRALSLPVDPERAVAGDIRTGDRVDVYSTDERAPGLVAADLEVLDVSRSHRGALGGGDGQLSVVVTVSSAQADRLSTVLGGTKFMLVLATGAAPAPTPESTASSSAPEASRSG